MELKVSQKHEVRLLLTEIEHELTDIYMAYCNGDSDAVAEPCTRAEELMERLENVLKPYIEIQDGE